MSRKKKVFITFLIIVVISLCIYLGMKTRYSNKINITVLGKNGYVITTIKNNIIIVDGGDSSNTDILKEIIKEHNNLVTAWITTSPEQDRIGALSNIIKDEKSDIQINNILHNLNYEEDWFDKLNLTQQEKEKMKNNIEIITLGKYRERTTEMGRRAEYYFDNFYITPLEINDTNSNEMADQRAILKIDNTFKNVILFNGVDEKNANIFLENDKDQFDVEAILFNGGKETKNEIRQKIENEVRPKIAESENTEENTKSTIEIW